MRVAEYNENPIGLRIAHLDIYMTQEGYIVTPFTKGEVHIAQQIVDAVNDVDRLSAELAAIKAENERLAYEVLGLLGECDSSDEG